MKVSYLGRSTIFRRRLNLKTCRAMFFLATPLPPISFLIMQYYFVVIGATDNPIYETEIIPSSRSTSVNDPNRRDDHKHLNQFIVHAALDVVEEVQWNTQAMYLKSIDRFNEYFVSCFVTAGNVKLMLLHDQKSEDSIKNFFNEIYEQYIKILMNPFYEKNATITSSQFDSRVKMIARRFL